MNISTFEKLFERFIDAGGDERDISGVRINTDQAREIVARHINQFLASGDELDYDELMIELDQITPEGALT